LAKKILMTLILLLLAGSAGAVQEAPLDKTGNYFSQAGVIQGGEITDGRDLRSIRWGRHPDFERIVLDIYKGAYQEKGPPARVPCFFQVEYQYYPFRLTITLRGIRARHAQLGEFPGSELIHQAYMLPFLDDSGFKLALALEGAVEYEVFELHDPARIVIDVRPYPPREDMPRVYSLRTETGFNFEELDYFKETATGTGSTSPRIIQAEDGQLFFEEGYYSEEALARERLEAIAPHFPEVSFFIEPRGPRSIPAASSPVEEEF